MLRLHLRRYEPSWTGGGHGRPLKQPVQLPGDATLQTAADLALAFALGGAAGHIALGGLVVALAEQHDGVQRLIQLAIAAAVEPMANHPAEEASMGAAPASMAKAASERSRPGCDS